VALRIPAIGVDVSLPTLGLNADHTVQVPTDFQQAGWFGLGPSPGQTGSAVILGHVDSYTGPAVFFQIRTPRAGNQVNVSLANGAVAHFRVSAMAMYAKDQFPARQVYAPHGGSARQLLTCGGTLNSEDQRVGLMLFSAWRTQSRPAVFAVYIAVSAAAVSASMLVPSPG